MAERFSELPKDEITRTKLETPGLGFDRWWLLVFAVIAMIAILSISTPDPYRRALFFVSDGIIISIGVTAIAFVLTVVLGLFGGLGRLSKNKVIQGIATLYVEVVRGIPLMVQLLFWYFAFPAIIQDFGRPFQYRAISALSCRPDCHGNPGPDGLLRRVYERDLPGRDPEHRQRADGSRAQPGHVPDPGHALCDPAPGHPRDPAAGWATNLFRC